jgi:hypothetical protein
MKKSVSNVVAGGLITGATIMGMDAIYNSASADIMELQQTQDFNFDFSDDANTVAMTCCFDSNRNQEFFFAGFDNNLGDLVTVTLDISFSSLTFDPTDVSDFGGGIQFVGRDMNTATLDAAQFVGILNTVTLDAAQFAGNANTATLDFNMLFENAPLFINDENRGSMTLSYFYELTAVPTPGSAALMAPALAALLASGAYRRRRREEDE